MEVALHRGSSGIRDAKSPGQELLAATEAIRRLVTHLKA
ncbi:hypothetical protein JT362_31370 [Actinophytocola sp. S1-96]|uniref:Uncharacterized protein n=1 Tax=Actinophytocola gossypii TaxID=2812003 RepID=A0ABT2JIB7_9PSEU|nr:hypothetical protein [Actinophytocola gossypii]